MGRDVNHFHREDEERRSIDYLIDLWWLAETAPEANTNEALQNTSIKSLRDVLVDQQEKLAQAIMRTQTIELTHILQKLLMWQSAYGPPTDQSIESGGDTYRLMVVSAIQDLQELLRIRDQEVSK